MSPTGLEILRRMVIFMLLERRALRFGEFRMKLHETNPDAPLSPVYLNMRTEEHPDPKKRGPLNKDNCFLIAQALAEITLPLPGFQGFVAGLPYAADPFVEAASNTPAYHGLLHFVKLDKRVDPISGHREIIPASGIAYPIGKNVVLWDDLITQAGSKLEATESLRRQGCEVTDIVVIVDRQQGGSEKLLDRGLRVHALLPFLDFMLPFARQGGHVNDDDWRRCQSYFSVQGHPLPEKPITL